MANATLQQKAAEYETLYEKAEEALRRFVGRYGHHPASTTKEDDPVKRQEAVQWEEIRTKLVRLCKSVVDIK